MKRVILNIPEDVGDILSVTCIGGAGTATINVNCVAFDLTSGEKDEVELFVPSTKEE